MTRAGDVQWKTDVIISKPTSKTKLKSKELRSGMTALNVVVVVMMMMMMMMRRRTTTTTTTTTRRRSL